MQNFKFNLSSKYDILDGLQKLSTYDLFHKLRSLTTDKIVSSSDIKQFNKIVECNKSCKNNKCTVSFLQRRGFTLIEFNY